MENCLVTKLKGVVDNGNLELFGFNTIHVKVNQSMNFNDDFFRIKGDNYVTLVQSGQTSKVIRCLTEDVTMSAVISDDEILVKVDKMPSSGVLVFAINKYETTYINLQGYYNTYDMTEIIQFYAPCYAILNSNSYINNNLNLFGKAKLSGIRSQYNSIVGDIEILSTLSQLTTINIQNSPRVIGDLSALKDLPNIETVIIVNTGVTDNEDTVTYLRNRGVNVTFSSNA